MFKIFSTVIVEQIYKIGHLEGNFTPVLYMGRKVPKGEAPLLEGEGGSGSTDQRILHVDTNECEWTASHLGHVTLQYVFRRRLGGPHGLGRNAF